MKKTGILFVALLVLLMAGCKPSGKKEISDNTSALKGYISLSGAFALYPIVVLWADEFRKVNPGVRIDISAGGAGKGIADALSGMVDLGMVSREISPQEVDLGAWYIALTKDAVLPTINAANPYYNELSKRGVTKEQLYDVFVTGNITTWDELVGKPAGTKIRLYTRSDACGAASMWASFLGKTQEELLGTGVFGDPGIADAIKNDPLGLGYNNVNYVFDIRSRKKFDKMEVLPIDLDSNGTIDENENNFSTLDKVNDAIVKGDYPSPPARDLYFVSKGRPEKPEVTAFIEYILTEGQKFVGQAGYVPLSEEKINKQLEKLNP